jgi:hypothetical protein
MGKKELFDKVCACVSSALGVRIEGCKKQECVDARTMVVQILVEHGLSEKDIADLLSMTRQGVNKLKNSFPQRMRNWYFRNVWESLATNSQRTSN